MALRELLVKFGVEVESEKLEKFGDKIGHVTHMFKEFSEIFLASLIGEKLHEFVEEQIKLGDELDDTAERLGVTTDALQQFQLAGQLAGASAEESTTALRFLNKNLGEAAMGSKEVIKTFQELHLDTKALTDDSVPLVDKLGQIAEGFTELKTHGEKTAYAMKIFGRGGTALVPMLSEGREKVEELFDAFEDLGGGMSKQFAKQANDAEHATVKLKFVMQALKSRIAMELIPSAMAMTERITKWVVGFIKLAKNTYALRTAIIALKLGAIIGIFLKIKSLVGETSGGFMGLIRTLFKLGPILLIAAALFLIFDDLYTLWEGGDSVIGKLIDTMFGVGTAQKVVEDLHQAWKGLGEWWSGEGMNGLQTFARAIVGSLVVACDALITAGQLLGGVFMFAWDAIGGKLTDADKDLKNMGKAVDDFGKRFDKIAGWVGGKGPDINAANPEAKIRQPIASFTGEDAKTGGLRGSMDVGKITINNNINGVSDPKEAAKHAGKATANAIEGNALRSAFGAIRTGAP